MKVEESRDFLKKTSLYVGICLLLIAIIAPIGHFGIIENLIHADDIELTITNIKDSNGLFGVGIVLLLLNAILDIIAGWGLYILLKRVNKNVSLLSVWLRIVYSGILIIALANFVNVIGIVNDSAYSGLLETNQLHFNVNLLINSFNNIWTLGYVVFGLHLVTLGYVIIKSGYLPKYLGILIIIAGAGYIIDHLGIILISSYNFEISMFTFIGEFVLVIVLLYKGYQKDKVNHE